MLIALRTDFGAQGLQALARRSKDAAQARRLLALALAMIYEGSSSLSDWRLIGSN